MVGKMTSRLERRLLGRGERNKGEGLAFKLRGRDKVPVCAKRTGKGNALEKLTTWGRSHNDRFGVCVNQSKAETSEISIFLR